MCRRQRSAPAPACVQMAAHMGLMGRGGGRQGALEGPGLRMNLDFSWGGVS